MPRIVKEHQERRNEILDTAQQLFYSKGYDNTSVADVINTIGIAKGTFYHYFKSKLELLDQIVDRQAREIDRIIDRVLEEPEENALVELNNIYAEIGHYKSEHKDVMLMITRAIYSVENILLRTKLNQIRVSVVAPKLARVIRRGIREGIFTTGNPDHIAQLIMNMGIFLSDEFARYALEEGLTPENGAAYLDQCRNYEYAVECILGIEHGAIQFIDPVLITEYFEKD